jgi:hypothetical protein
MRIPRSQFPVPIVFALPLEAEQRMIGGTAAFDRVVTDAGVLLVPIEHQHRGVDIEEESCRSLRSLAHALEKSIVQSAQPRQHCRRCTQQEPPQRGGIRVRRQAGEILEDAVLSEQLSGLESLQPQDHRIDRGQQHLADAVAVVPLLHTNRLRDCVLEADPREKPRHQIDATVVRQVLRAEIDRKLSRASGHHSKPYLKGSFCCNDRMSRDTPRSRYEP